MKVDQRYKLADKLRPRYLRATRVQRGVLLDAFCDATGYNRKYATAVLRGRERTVRTTPRGRVEVYGPEFNDVLRLLWEATYYVCAERLQPVVLELADRLEHHHQLTLEPTIRAQLGAVSVSTVERHLRPLRADLRRHMPSYNHGQPALRREVPVVVGAWKELDRPGLCEADLVSHCGPFAPGEWAYTVTVTDICTGWTELEPVFGKGKAGIILALDAIRRRLPFPLVGIHTDNGSEFLNAHFFSYCQANDILFTRGRPHYSNDNPHVEQKNGSLVRRFAGYHRFDSDEHLEWLRDLYANLCPFANLFLPVIKLVGRDKVSGRTIKRYDRPTTPLNRVLLSGVSSPAQLELAIREYDTLSPLSLKRIIYRHLSRLPALMAPAANA